MAGESPYVQPLSELNHSTPARSALMLPCIINIHNHRSCIFHTTISKKITSKEV